MNVKNIIKEKLINHHLTASVDKYGQMKALDFYQIFDNDSKLVLNFLKINKNILKTCTYGSTYGIYLGINEIVDKEIYNECKKALSINPNYKRAMTN